MRNGLRVGAVALCAALAAPASAAAASQLSIKPSLSGRLGGNGAISFTLTNSDSLGGLPSPMAAPFVAHLPAGIKYNVGSFATCSTALIQAASGATPPNCSSASTIGTGTATLGALIGGQALNEQAQVHVFLTRKSPVTIEFWARGNSPIPETLIFPGTLSRDSAPYGEKLTVQVPKITTLPGSPDASTLSFSTTFKATRRVHGRTISEFTLPKTCKKPLRWSGTTGYEDGTSSTANATTACPRR
jgi:hypothetical protein